MPKLLDTLWPAFVSEIAEQLDSLELLLARSENPAMVDIDQLFRGFHTIKGNCAMVGFTSMETLSHLSEDILSAVRNDANLMTDTVVDLLLESISALKKQFTDASESKQNPAENHEINRRLNGFIQHLSSDTQEAKAQPKELSLFAEAAQVAIPAVALSLSGQARLTQAKQTLSTFVDLAHKLGFTALLSSMRQFIKRLTDSKKTDNCTLKSLAAEVFDDIANIAQAHNLDLGIETGSKLCRAKLGADYTATLMTLNTLLTTLHESEQTTWIADQFLELVSLAQALSEFTLLQQLKGLTPIWRYSKQLVIDAARGHIFFDHTIIAGLLDLVALAKDYQDDADYVHLCLESLSRFQATVARLNNGRDELLIIKQRIMATTRLAADTLAGLNMDTLTTLDKALSHGFNCMEIDLDFSQEAISEKLLTSLQQLGQIVHSRTLFHDLVGGVAQRTSFCFLLLTKKTINGMDRILSVIDKGAGCYRLVTTETSTDAEETLTDPAQAGAETSQLVKETRLALNALKVDGKKVDQLIADTGEALILQNKQHYLLKDKTFNAHLNALAARSQDPEFQASLAFLRQYHETLSQQGAALQTALTQLQSSTLNLRVVPIAYVFDRFHGLVRSTAKKLGKQVELEISGSDVKIDKAMIDRLSEPLAHIIRNSIDHGIERQDERKRANKTDKGHIYLAAKASNDAVIIHIRDDGKGLDTERIRKKSVDIGLIAADETDENIIHASIFEPGFSTATDLSETSGRGVGMDIVKTRVHQVGGSLLLSSQANVGTTVTLTLPVSAAIQQVVLIEINNQTVALPERHTVEIIHINAPAIQVANSQSIWMFREQVVPLFHLGKLLVSSKPLALSEKSSFEVIIISNTKTLIGLIVDNIAGRSEVLVKDSHQAIKHMPGVSNAALLDDGSVAVILDTAYLFRLSEQQTHNILTQ